jgi:excisionase family DNA binding protein
MAVAGEIMTVDDLAAYLRLDRQTIYRRFRKGELPGVKIGKAIRFKRDVIDGWIRRMSFCWTEADRAELRGWAGAFARRRGIREKDVASAVAARRRRSR